MKKPVLSLLLAVALVLLFGVFAHSEAAPEIEVDPLVHDFGDVELGENSTTFIEITNTGGHNLLISDISFQLGSDPDFSITQGPGLPQIIPPPDGNQNYLYVEIKFEPTSEGYAAADLEIVSNDPESPLVNVMLGGVGVAVSPPPVTIDDILAFFDESVANGTLVGNGRGNSADGRRNALRNQIEAAGDLIDDWCILDACSQLLTAYKRCDGLPRPPEFVAGPAAATLAQMILDLMGELGCS